MTPCVAILGPRQLNINTHSELLNNPKLGASWESFALEQIIMKHQAQAEDCYFWASHQGAELDLLLTKDNQRIGFEIKYASAPKLTKSMQIVMDNLSIERLIVIYPGTIDFPLRKDITVLSLEHYLV